LLTFLCQYKKVSEVWDKAPLAIISKIKALIGCDFLVNKTKKY